MPEQQTQHQTSCTNSLKLFHFYYYFSYYEAAKEQSCCSQPAAFLKSDLFIDLYPVFYTRTCFSTISLMKDSRLKYEKCRHMLFTIYFISIICFISKFLLHFVIFFSVIDHLLMENCKLAVKLLLYIYMYSIINLSITWFVHFAVKEKFTVVTEVTEKK